MGKRGPLIICPPQQAIMMAGLTEHCVLYRQVRGAPIAPWCAYPLPLFFLPPFLLPSWPAMLVQAPAAQPSPSINLHMCWERRWCAQTTVTTGTLHQRVIWLSQAHWQTALCHGAEAKCHVSDGRRLTLETEKRSIYTDWRKVFKKLKHQEIKGKISKLRKGTRGEKFWKMSWDPGDMNLRSKFEILILFFSAFCLICNWN